MFNVKAQYVRRISFASKIFPKIKSVIGLDLSKLKSTDQFDGELFCGGRSKNKDLLTFFGFIKESSGQATFSQLPLFRRSLKKLTNLVELQLETIGANEVLLPLLVPQKWWHESQRLKRQNNALDYVYKFTDHGDNNLLLGPTFEESITKLVAGLDSSYESELPLLLYQTSSKFRYEPNPRFGLIRSNEFVMNDTYSFDANLELAEKTYTEVSEVYDKIFKVLGLNCIKTQGGTGDIGGKNSHEYQLPVSSGEDTVVECNNCGDSYNLEIHSDRKLGSKESCMKCSSTNIRLTKALELGHTFLLSDIYSKPLKAKYTILDGIGRRNYEMGCYGLGLTRILAAGVDLLSVCPNSQHDDSFLQVRWPNEVEPYKIGLVTPAKRSKQYHGGSSEFIEKVVTRTLESTRNIDFLIEDRDKEGIGRRLVKLQSLGIPYIIVVGQRFLQDQAEVEFLRLDTDKKSYEQLWLTEDQLYNQLVNLDYQTI